MPSSSSPSIFTNIQVCKATLALACSCIRDMLNMTRGKQKDTPLCSFQLAEFFHLLTCARPLRDKSPVFLCEQLSPPGVVKGLKFPVGLSQRLSVLVQFTDCSGFRKQGESLLGAVNVVLLSSSVG